MTLYKVGSYYQPTRVFFTNFDLAVSYINYKKNCSYMTRYILKEDGIVETSDDNQFDIIRELKSVANTPTDICNMIKMYLTIDTFFIVNYKILHIKLFTTEEEALECYYTNLYYTDGKINPKMLKYTPIEENLELHSIFSYIYNFDSDDEKFDTSKLECVNDCSYSDLDIHCKCILCCSMEREQLSRIFMIYERGKMKKNKCESILRYCFCFDEFVSPTKYVNDHCSHKYCMPTIKKPSKKDIMIIVSLALEERSK